MFRPVEPYELAPLFIDPETSSQMKHAFSDCMLRKDSRVAYHIDDPCAGL